MSDFIYGRTLIIKKESVLWPWKEMTSFMDEPLPDPCKTCGMAKRQKVFLDLLKKCREHVFRFSGKIRLKKRIFKVHVTREIFEIKRYF